MTCQNSKEPPAGLSRVTQLYEVAVDRVCSSMSNIAFVFRRCKGMQIFLPLFKPRKARMIIVRNLVNNLYFSLIVRKNLPF